MSESDVLKERGLLRRWWVIALLGVMLLAVVLRMWQLESVPPGYTHDEAGHGYDALAILNGARPLFQTVGYGREPLYDYVAAGAMALLGPTGRALRLVSVGCSLITLLATFAWARLAFGKTTALAATALQAVSFWSLSTSRQALRSSLLPALLTLAVWMYWSYAQPALKSDERKPALLRLCLFSLLVGATLYTYIPARIVWLLFPAFLAYLALTRRESARRVWLATLGGVLVGLLLSAPLLTYLWANPDLEQRVGMLSDSLRALRDGNLELIAARAWSGLSGLVLPGHGDDFLAYNVPGRPTLGPLTAALFLVGIFLCLVRWRRPECAFSLMWFGLGVLPALVTWGATASTTRSIAALPVTFLFPALTVVVTARWVGERWSPRVAGMVWVAFAMLVCGTAYLTVRDYFRWGDSVEVRAAYRHTLVETAAYLDRQVEGGVVAVSTVYPNAPHDPYVLQLALERENLSLRWFDARWALILPAESSARLVFSAETPVDPYFAELPGRSIQTRVDLRADDLAPFFEVDSWDVQQAWAALSQRVQTLEQPADFGGGLRLVGFDLRTPQVEVGGIIELVTVWEVLDPEPLRPQDEADVRQELVLFTHVLDEAGTILTQADRLDAPAWDWQAGDIVAQIHRLTVPEQTQAESVGLWVGAYRQNDVTRLPLLVDGQPVGDAVLLRQVEIVQR